MPEMPKPYRGLFVLDASQGIAGPYCATLLAACGADVVKVEPPAGDWSRGLSTREGSQSVMHVSFNRGKRSVMLDLQTEAVSERMGKIVCQLCTPKRSPTDGIELASFHAGLRRFDGPLLRLQHRGI